MEQDPLQRNTQPQPQQSPFSLVKYDDNIPNSAPPVSDSFLAFQQDLSELHIAFYSLLTGQDFMENEKGDYVFVKTTRPLLNEEGAKHLVRLYKGVINKNTLNSNLDDKQIRYMLSNLSDEIQFLLYANCKDWAPDEEGKSPRHFLSVSLMVKNFILYSTYSTFRRALNGEERKSSRQRYSISDIRTKTEAEKRKGFFGKLSF